jgi:hypothetical protein
MMSEIICSVACIVWLSLQPVEYFKRRLHILIRFYFVSLKSALYDELFHFSLKSISRNFDSSSVKAHNSAYIIRPIEAKIEFVQQLQTKIILNLGMMGLHADEHRDTTPSFPLCFVYGMSVHE